MPVDIDALEKLYEGHCPDCDSLLVVLEELRELRKIADDGDRELKEYDEKLREETTRAERAESTNRAAQEYIHDHEKLIGRAEKAEGMVTPALAELRLWQERAEKAEATLARAETEIRESYKTIERLETALGKRRNRAEKLEAALATAREALEQIRQGRHLTCCNGGECDCFQSFARAALEKISGEISK